ncbi:MAG: discoidin domain-containing protein [Myxococcales bacterium]|nr:discoidin domain-containing protein [Polyangiaceae bacterium]MDW8249672.1 discoidin domain-containing protein [Myxococcales bacterium]
MNHPSSMDPTLPEEEPTGGDDDLAPKPTPPQPPTTSPFQTAVEWFSRSKALADAYRDLSERPPNQQQALRLACLAEEGAERALNPVDPFRYGPGTSLALSLYAEALYWALLAQPDAPPSPDLPSAWSAASRANLVELAGSEEALARIEQVLLLTPFPQRATLPEEEQRTTAWNARILVGALIERAEGAERTIRRLRIQRWTRSLLLLGALVLLIFGSFQGLQRLTEGPNLAAGKPWRASSAYQGFNPSAHICDGNITKILFHTNEEDRPWFEVDLGVPQPIRVVEVTNRTDGFQERAVPLVIELSDDHLRWREVARKNETFNHWKAKFALQHARYVRVRAQRRTFLHLEGVAVRSK